MAIINYPFQKGIAVRAFPEFWGLRPWRRRRDPLQVGSGIRAWHDELLSSAALNRRGSRLVVGVYNEMAREVGRGL